MKTASIVFCENMFLFVFNWGEKRAAGKNIVSEDMLAIKHDKLAKIMQTMEEPIEKEAAGKLLNDLGT